MMLLEYFQMVDRVEEIDADAERIVCRATVPEFSTVFDGHFPGQPLVPGTLLIEAMAQASGFMVMNRLGFERLPYLIQVDKAKIRSFVEPLTELVLLGDLVHEGSGFAITTGTVRKDDERIVTAELRFRTMPFPNDELRRLVLDRAEGVGLTVGGHAPGGGNMEKEE
jgi:3-hydroxyacyl-[acyl-carrier-protein] dehydratase